jgi:TetR/AcrR family transcriptional regulator, regulator of mycofactocin system
MTSASPSDSAPPNLRTRNLARNRAEVSGIALALFAERGYEAVTVDDIVRAAGISKRTFFRYFESKEGVVLPFEDERLEQLRHALATRPHGEPVLTTIRHAALAIAAAEAPDDSEHAEALTRLRIVLDNPSVYAHSLAIYSHWEEIVRDLVADHLGVDPTTSVEARVIAGATIAATRTAAEVWVTTDGEADLLDLLAQAFDVLTAGLTLTAP